MCVASSRDTISTCGRHVRDTAGALSNRTEIYFGGQKFCLASRPSGRQSSRTISGVVPAVFTNTIGPGESSVGSKKKQSTKKTSSVGRVFSSRPDDDTTDVFSCFVYRTMPEFEWSMLFFILSDTLAALMIRGVKFTAVKNTRGIGGKKKTFST